MNPVQGQTPQQGQPQGQPQGQAGPGAQKRPPPMYQPNQIRKLPMLSEEEKTRYEQGLAGLWARVNSNPANSPDSIQARQKIIEFSKMLFGKIQQRRTQQGQQGQQGQQAQQGQQGPQGQQAAQPVPSAPSAQPAQPAQAQPAQPQQPQPGQPRPTSAQNQTGQGPTQAPGQPQAQGQQPPQPPQQPAQQNASQTQQASPAQGGAATAAAQRGKIPESVLQHMNKMSWRPPPQLADKPAAEITKWVQEIKERYAKALLAMDSSKKQVTELNRLVESRNANGNPLKEEEMRQVQARKEQQMKVYQENYKWVEGVRKQQASIQPGNQANQNGQASGTQQGESANAGGNKAPTAAQQNVATPTTAGAAAAKPPQQATANRPSPANGTSTPTQTPVRPPIPNAQQPGNFPQGQAQGQQPQVAKSENHPHPAPINTAAAQASAQIQASATPTQAAAAGRVPTPQTATPSGPGGPARPLSHSAAMSLANQRANNTTPGGGSAAAQQPSVGTPGSNGAVNQNVMGSGVQQQQQQQQQQGHSHAHPAQPTLQSKMPIPKQLPEKATAVPQGVTVGGGAGNGRPTITQGSGTLGGVMNQPTVNKIPAYSHDAEGDHVLSKKKLDELVRQVCGGSAEGSDDNMLTPEVEESVLNMADSFVDNVLHAACRNSKERGSKVLEIRDIQLILERTYNIRVPGYSSDELRTVRKVQPSPGWIAKMSAVQAAKVMPGKGE